MKNIDFDVDTISCDWITVGSFDQRNRKRWELVMSGESRISGFDGKWRQYTGVNYDGGFVGQAEQGGRLHTLCYSSGMNANRVLYRMLRASAGEHRYTRLDIQLTVSLPDWYRARVLADWLNSQIPKCAVLIESHGMDTVYVWSRQSSNFWRIYVKEDDEGERYLRYELEVKKGKDDTAGRLANLIKAKGHPAMVGYFLKEWDRVPFPNEHEDVIEPYRKYGTLPLPKQVRDVGNRRYMWLDTTVKKAILSFAAESHGRAQFTVKWLHELVSAIQDMQEPLMDNKGE